MANMDEFKKEAKEAAREAKEAAKEVAGEAKEAAKGVFQDAKEAAREVAEEAKGAREAENIDDLRQEAEEAKERIRKDIEEAGDVLRRIAEESAQIGTPKVEEAVQRAEKWVAKMTERVEKRFDRAVTTVLKSSGNNHQVITREFDFSDFTNVDIGGAFRVEIVHSDSYQVSVTAEARLFNYIDVNKSGNTLKITVKSHHSSMRTTRRVRIAMPVLKKLRMSGASRGTVKGFSSEENFDLNLGGASTLDDIDIRAGKTTFEISGASRVSGNVELGDAEFTLSGSGRVELKGSANRAVLNAWGASNLNLADFTINDTSVNLKGVSRATCGECRGNLALDLSGASRFEYAGEPTISDIKLSGASTIRKK